MTKLSYDEWKRRVDMELVKLCTMTSDDIDDWYYSDDYRAGRTPLATAKRAYRNARNAMGM